MGNPPCFACGAKIASRICTACDCGLFFCERCQRVHAQRPTGPMLTRDVSSMLGHFSVKDQDEWIDRMPPGS